MTEIGKRKVVEVVESSKDHERVKIRTIYEPLFIEMWRIASKKVEMYHTDIIHDALMLANSNVGNKFLWGFRPTGTTLVRLTNHRALTIATIACMSDPLDSWHLVEITNIRAGGMVDGYLTWLNAKDISHLHRVIDDNVDV